jgi:squalene-hopene/tetraprenyl-beta-curcumene cyclase
VLAGFAAMDRRLKRAAGMVFMSFTGPRMDAGGATLDMNVSERHGDGVRTGTRGTGETIPQRQNLERVAPDRHPFEPIDQRTVATTIDATASWLLARQASDGHWRGPLEGDTILESEYILLLAWAGRMGRPEIAGAIQRILNQQLPGGGWAIHPGGPVDVSASVKAYLALKITGHDPHSEPLCRARAAIERAGGPWAVNSFTKFYLALLGQMAYADCPAVPPEMVLLPDWFPVNLHRVSAWSRTMIVPLSLMWAFKPVRAIAPEQGISELFASQVGRNGPAPVGGSGGWARFFRGVDWLLKACDNVGFRPLRSRAVAACRRWMLERFDGSDGLGAIFPPIVWSILALRAMGCDDDSAEVQECWRQLDRLVEHEPDGTTRLEPCRSPVWDTAISLRALSDAATAGRRLIELTHDGVAGVVPADESVAARLAAVDWLLDREIRRPGDWTHAAAAVAPSGWCFQYANRFYPDVDDTAMVLIALATWRDSVVTGRELVDGVAPRLARFEAVIGRAVAWLESMQSSDGGWGAFDRDNNMELLCKVPFADHNAMIDPSSPDLAGRVLEAYGKLGLRPGHPSVDRAVAYLRTTQESDGSWFGRWGVNYVYGTWQAIEGLRAIGLPADDAAVSAGADWLARHQQPCGGWGETPESYTDRSLAGCGTPTASQTAWAVAGLVAAGRHDTRETRRGVQWLATRQSADGSWEESEFTGTGFPKVFYLRYHYYRIYFPLMALARFSQAAACSRSVRERVA